MLGTIVGALIVLVVGLVVWNWARPFSPEFPVFELTDEEAKLLSVSKIRLDSSSPWLCHAIMFAEGYGSDVKWELRRKISNSLGKYGVVLEDVLYRRNWFNDLFPNNHKLRLEWIEILLANHYANKLE
jgi:hypothetical protein